MYYVLCTRVLYKISTSFNLQAQTSHNHITNASHCVQFVVSFIAWPVIYNSPHILCLQFDSFK